MSVKNKMTLVPDLHKRMINETLLIRAKKQKYKTKVVNLYY